MNEHDLRTKFPNASDSFIRANLSAGDTEQVAKLESNPGHGALGKKKVQRSTGQRFFILVTSVRKRLLDEDNLCEKYHVDLCRYAGILPSDAPGQVQIKVCQRKAGKGENEETIIEIYAA